MTTDDRATEEPIEEPLSGDPPDTTSQKRECLAQFLRYKTRDGAYYCKSKFVAAELDLTPKEIGYLMTEIENGDPELDVEQWSNARAITWRVTRQE